MTTIKTKIKTRKILYCEGCEEWYVYSCSHCGKVFDDGDTIGCDQFNDAHYCEGCIKKFKLEDVNY